jgi:hypothetical protein
MVAALAPVTLGGYGLSAHEVWALSSLLVLVGYLVVFAVMAGTPEYQANTRDWYGGTRGWRWWVTQVASFLFVGMVFVGLVSVILGLFPDQEAALYSRWSCCPCSCPRGCSCTSSSRGAPW